MGGWQGAGGRHSLLADEPPLVSVQSCLAIARARSSCANMRGVPLKALRVNWSSTTTSDRRSSAGPSAHACGRCISCHDEAGPL